MNKSILIALGTVLLTSLVFAITLTADATDHFDVPAAFKTEVCNSQDAADCKELILGIAQVYVKGNDTGTSNGEMIVFEMDDQIYRTTGEQYTYYPVEDGQATGTVIQGMPGRSNVSQVAADGTETDTDIEYRVELPYVSGKITDELRNVEFKINGVNYVLKQILDQSSFSWTPGTGIIDLGIIYVGVESQ